MTPQFYMLLWLFYLLAVAVAFVCAWRVSRSWPFPLKAFGRIALAVIFLTPTPQVAEGGWLAPAFISMIFDQMQGAPGGWFRAGIYLVISAALGILVYGGMLVRWFLHRRPDSVDRD